MTVDTVWTFNLIYSQVSGIIIIIIIVVVVVIDIVIPEMFSDRSPEWIEDEQLFGHCIHELYRRNN